MTTFCHTIVTIAFFAAVVAICWIAGDLFRDGHWVAGTIMLVMVSGAKYKWRQPTS